jgi:hypothetical protein
MRFRATCTALAILASLAGSLLFADDEAADSRPAPGVMLDVQKYFPMTKGSLWEYKTESISTTGPDRYEGKITRKVVKEKKNGCILLETDHDSSGSTNCSEITVKVKDGHIIRQREGSKGKWHIFGVPPRPGRSWTNTVVMTG